MFGLLYLQFEVMYAGTFQLLFDNVCKQCLLTLRKTFYSVKPIKKWSCKFWIQR